MLVFGAAMRGVIETPYRDGPAEEARLSLSWGTSRRYPDPDPDIGL